MIVKIKFWLFGFQNIDFIILFKSLKKLDGFDFVDFINFIKSRNIKDFVIIEKKFGTIFCQSVFDLMGQTLTNEQAEQVHNLIMYNRLTIFEKIKYHLTNLKNKIMAKQKPKPTKKEVAANIELLENNKIENVVIENEQTETERQNVANEFVEDLKNETENVLDENESVENLELKDLGTHRIIETSKIIVKGKSEIFSHITLSEFNDGKTNFLSIEGNNFKVEKLLENHYKVEFITNGKIQGVSYVKIIK